MSWLKNRFQSAPKSFFEWVLLFIAAVLFPFVEIKRWLSDRVYRGWEGAFRGFIGGVLGLAASVGTGYHLGWELGHAWYSWLLLGILAWPLTFWYAWPIGYLIVIKPVWEVGSLFWDIVNRFSKKYLHDVLTGLLGILRAVFPGSNRAWEQVLHEHYRSWVQVVLHWVAYPATVIGGLWFGHQSYLYVLGAIAHPILGLVAGIAAGLLVFLAVISVLWNWFEYGKVPALAVTTGGALLWYFVPYITTVVHGLGFGTAAVCITGSVLFVLWMAYGYPLSDLFLKDGIKKAVKKLEPLAEKAYDEQDKAYRTFFHHVVNIGVCWLLFTWVSWLAAGLGLTYITGLCLAIAAVVVGYVFVFRLLDHDGGNVFVSVPLSLYAGWQAGSAYLAAGYLFGIAGAIVVAVIAAFLFGLVAFPLAYLTLRAVARTIGLSLLGTPLAWIYNQVGRLWNWLMKQVDRLYSACYHDKTGYEEFFLHAVNLVVTAGAFLGIAYGTSSLPALLAWPTIFAGGALTYLLLGRYLLKTGVGNESVGAVASLTAAVYVGTWVHSVYALWWVDAIVGLIALLAAYCLLFPIAYLALRLLARPLLASWLRNPLAGLHKWAWRWFAGIWSIFESMWSVVRQWLRPYLAVIAAWWEKLRAAYERVRRMITGR